MKKASRHQGIKAPRKGEEKEKTSADYTDYTDK